MGRRRSKSKLGLIFAVLGTGLVLALTVPAKYLVVIIAFALIISGVALCKS